MCVGANGRKSPDRVPDVAAGSADDLHTRRVPPQAALTRGMLGRLGEWTPSTRGLPNLNTTSGRSEDPLQAAHGGPASIGAHPACTLHLNRATGPESAEESAVVRLSVLPPGDDRTLVSGPEPAECDGVEVTRRMPL
jgi:hypothetical protein